MAGYERIQRAIIATTAVLVLATACGRVAAPGAASAAQVIRNADDPYFAGHVPATVTTTTQVVRDPDNPYWVGNPNLTSEAANLTGEAAATRSTTSVIRDPDNPYWTGR